MSGLVTRFECQRCGETFLKWQGKCEACHSWNTLTEIKEVKKRPSSKDVSSGSSMATPLIQVQPEDIFYYKTTINEFDHVLGKGLVKGSVSLLGGEPGIGKSTLSLQVSQKCASQGLKVLYISSEESESQLKLRAQRLGHTSESLYVLSETNMLTIIKECDRINPDIILLDSIQVVHHPEIGSLEGTINQVRYCASTLINWVKAHHKSAIMIGHITKDGHIAGPKVLEHLVDVILYFEGDRHFQYRVLRCHKNRYGSTDIIGLFEMKSSGLQPIDDPSKAFLEARSQHAPGSVIVPYAEGSRVLLIEIQALVVESGYGIAKRNFVGVNPNRANVLIAALDKCFKLRLSSFDIFLSVIGGFNISDPSADLAMIVALVSSLRQQSVGQGFAVCGEVSLTGEVRPIPFIKKRLLESQKSGFTDCIIPEKNNRSLGTSSGITIHSASHIQHVMTTIFSLEPLREK